jgi:hypothetical protein
MIRKTINKKNIKNQNLEALKENCMALKTALTRKVLSSK